ncbi:hypothetical protein LP420_04280 [Massilia sp. B-10]|nr:hypothetical protein LP420_04280 [Massilia sp. B-10]
MDRTLRQAKDALGDKMLRTIPGDRGRLDDSLKHGCAIYRGSKQLASGYVSDNAPWHVVEFAINHLALAERPPERRALLHWLEYQKQRLGGREPKTHQRGDPVDWFRLGFGEIGEAFTFLSEFDEQRRLNQAWARWAIPETEANGMGLPPGCSVVAEVATGRAAAELRAVPQEHRTRCVGRCRSGLLR